MAMQDNPNYKSPRPSLCDCEEDFHEPNCLFYDPYVDDPKMREEMDHYQSLLDSMGDEDGCVATGEADDPTMVYDPYYGCYVPLELSTEGGTAQLAGGPPPFVFKSCRHYMDGFTLPSGTVVYLSGWSHTPIHRSPEMIPDVGFYLDKSWIPCDNFAYSVSWTDFGLPTIPEWHVVRAARAALAHAEQGDVVEVGCLGAHGRTGSFLAIMVMCDDPSYSGKRAIKYVRENHCYHAVETKQQEQYVSKIKGMLKRGEV